MQPVFKNTYSKKQKKFNYSFDYPWNEYGHSVVAEESVRSNLLFRAVY